MKMKATKLQNASSKRLFSSRRVVEDAIDQSKANVRCSWRELIPKHDAHAGYPSQGEARESPKRTPRGDNP
jgi:hypothetical protein